MRKKILNNLLIIVGLLIFFYIIFFIIDVKILLRYLKQINIYYLIPVFILNFFLIGFKAKRWQKIMTIYNIKYTLTKSFAFYSTATFLSIFTPGKIGELAKIYYLKKDNQPTKESLITILFDRLFDLITLGIFLGAGFLLFISFFGTQLLYFTSSVLLIILIIYIFFKYKVYKILIKKLLPPKYRSSSRFHIEDFIDKIKKIRPKNWLTSLLLSITAWLVYTSQLYLLGMALGLHLNFLFLIPMIAVASAADLLPISFNGLGTREAVFIFFFAFIGLSAEKATALSIIQLFIVLSSAIIGFAYWLKNPIKIKKDKSPSTHSLA